MTRPQWALVAFVGIIAVVAFARTEQIALRLGMAGIVPVRRVTAGGIV